MARAANRKNVNKVQVPSTPPTPLLDDVFRGLMKQAKVPRHQESSVLGVLRELRREHPKDTPAALFQRARSKGAAIPPAHCVHGVRWGECVVCDATVGTRFYFTGGGTHVHSTPKCTALAEGQEKVRRRGGNPEPIEVVTRYGDRLDNRDPCKVCLPGRSRDVTRRVPSSSAAKQPFHHFPLTRENAPPIGRRLYWGSASGTIVKRTVGGMRISVGGSTLFVPWGEFVSVDR